MNYVDDISNLDTLYEEFGTIRDDGRIPVVYSLKSEEYRTLHVASFLTVDDLDNDAIEATILADLHPNADFVNDGVLVRSVDGVEAHVCGDECRSNGCHFRYGG